MILTDPPKDQKPKKGEKKMVAYIFMESKNWSILKTQWELFHKKNGDIDIVKKEDEVSVEKFWKQEHELKNITIIA